MFVKLIISDKAVHHSLLPHTPQLRDVHNGSFTALQTILGVHWHCWQTLNTIKILRAAGPHLIIGNIIPVEITMTGQMYFSNQGSQWGGVRSRSVEEEGGQRNKSVLKVSWRLCDYVTESFRVALVRPCQ